MSPYITPDRRPDLDEQDPPQTVGELTYVYFRYATHYLEDHGESFQTYAEIIAALEATKLELARRRLTPYEDTKLLTNGDVV